jgi:hypothetical protein
MVAGGAVTGLAVCGADAVAVLRRIHELKSPRTTS